MRYLDAFDAGVSRYPCIVYDNIEQLIRSDGTGVRRVSKLTKQQMANYAIDKKANHIKMPERMKVRRTAGKFLSWDTDAKL